MVKCPKCGAEIKYIPVFYTADPQGSIAVEPEYTEIISDSGRVIKGRLRHRCMRKEIAAYLNDSELFLALGYSNAEIEVMRSRWNEN